MQTIKFNFRLRSSNPYTIMYLSRSCFYVFLLLGGLYVSPVLAQNISIDSLIKSFTQHKTPDKNRLNLAIQIASHYYYGTNLNKAAYYYNQELEIAKKLRDSVSIAYAYYDMSFVYKKRGDLRRCLQLLSASERYVKLPVHHKALLQILPQKALIIKLLGNRLLAVATYFEVEKLSREYQDSTSLAQISYDIGAFYIEEHNYAKAFIYQKTAYEIASRLPNKDLQAGMTLSLGNAYLNQKKYALAERYIKEAQQLAEGINNVSLVGYSLNGLGHIAHAQQKYRESHQYFEQAIPLFKSTSDSYGLAEALLYSGLIKSRFLYQAQKGLKDIKEAYTIIEKSGIKKRKLFIMKELAYTKLLLSYNTESASIIDSIDVIQQQLFSEAQQKTVAELETKYETQKKDTQIAEQKIVLLEDQKRLTQLVLGTTLLFLLLLGGFGLYRWQQNRKIIAMKSTFEANTQQLQAFNYSVSHDLRNPLLLTKEALNQLNSLGTEQETLRQKALTSVKNMDAIIEGLLTLSDIDSKPLVLKPLDMNELVNDILQEMDTHTQITVGILPTITADVVLMRQVMVNLLSNAIKYSQMQENCLIYVSGIAHEHQTTIQVQDNGIGFDESQKHLLFKPFGRLNTAFEGSGIGLVIVKRVIEKHGGSIWAKSQQGQGSTFGFDVPN